MTRADRCSCSRALADPVVRRATPSAPGTRVAELGSEGRPLGCGEVDLTVRPTAHLVDPVAPHQLLHGHVLLQASSCPRRDGLERRERSVRGRVGLGPRAANTTVVLGQALVWVRCGADVPAVAVTTEGVDEHRLCLFSLLWASVGDVGALHGPNFQVPRAQEKTPDTAETRGLGVCRKVYYRRRRFLVDKPASGTFTSPSQPALPCRSCQHRPGTHRPATRPRSRTSRAASSAYTPVYRNPTTYGCLRE